jgi:hypothetical protein
MNETISTLDFANRAKNMKNITTINYAVPGDIK